LAGLSAIQAPSYFGGEFPNLPRIEEFISCLKYSEIYKILT
jgi:hypothetical protein